MKWGREVHIGMSDAKHCRIIKLNYKQYSYITTHRFIFTPEGRELGGRFETSIFHDLAGWLDGMGVIISLQHFHTG
eukprot:scaffold14709_cov149-Skeletonema_marinoi.AAC.2